jgi:outer membrane usher protein
MALLAIVAFMCAGTARALADEGTAPQRALLELVVNGVSQGDALVVVRGPEIWVEVERLRDAGLHTLDGRRETTDGREFIELSSIQPALRVELDEIGLRLSITARPAALGHAVLEGGFSRPRGVVARRARAGFLDYGLTWSPGGQSNVALEGGASLGPWLLGTSMSATTGFGTVRGTTSLTLDQAERMNRWTVGDTFAVTGPLGGALPLAGLSVSRDFSLDPYFLRYPTVGLSGAVASPSTLEVYVNDQLVRREQLAPGTFELNRLTVPTGAGATRLVLRDAFGRERDIASAYYVTTALLARGVHQFQYAAGVVRQHAAFESFRYRGTVAAGSHRVGVTDWLTAGGRAEAAGGLFSGGPLVVTSLGLAGEIELAGAISSDRGQAGSAGSIAYTYAGRRFTAGTALRGQTDTYATASMPADAAKPTLDAGASVGVRVASRLSVNATWQDTSYSRGAGRIRSGTVSVSSRISRRASLFASLNRTAGGHDDRAAFVGLTLSAADRTTATVGAERLHGAGRALVDVQRSLPAGTGVGYRVRANSGSAGLAAAEASYQNRWGRVELRHGRLGADTSTSIVASGALVGIGGALFATRPLQDGYALVRVPGVANVRTFLSNQEIGRTNRRGDLLVPNLLSYYANRVRIADEDVPIDRTVGAVEHVVAPGFRAGAIVEFPVRRDTRILGSIAMDRRGQRMVPAAGIVSIEVEGRRIESPVGTNGEFYFENLAPGPHRARVRFEGDECEVTIRVPAAPDPVVQIGAHTCVVQ